VGGFGAAAGCGAAVGRGGVGDGAAEGAAVGGAGVGLGAAVGGNGVGVAAANVGNGTAVAGVRNSSETVATLTGVKVGRRVRVAVGVAADLGPAHAPNVSDKSISMVAENAANASHLRGLFRIGICIKVPFPGGYVAITYQAATNGSSSELRVW
jgi:hypothetical protein